MKNSTIEICNSKIPLLSIVLLQRERNFTDSKFSALSSDEVYTITDELVAIVLSQDCESLEYIGLDLDDGTDIYNIIEEIEFLRETTEYGEKQLGVGLTIKVNYDKLNTREQIENIDYAKELKDTRKMIREIKKSSNGKNEASIDKEEIKKTKAENKEKVIKACFHLGLHSWLDGFSGTIETNIDRYHIYMEGPEMFVLCNDANAIEKRFSASSPKGLGHKISNIYQSEKIKKIKFL